MQNVPLKHSLIQKLDRIEDRGVSAVEELHRVLNVEDHFNCDFIQMHDVEGGVRGPKETTR